jgi:glycosyltransferase involved in cell wall biosynthesis
MKVSVVIPTLNEEKNIGALVQSITAQTYSGVEVIVIDDGSTDATRTIARLHGARVLENKPGRRGPAFGRNRGAKAARGELVCFLDADCVIEDTSFVKKIVETVDDTVAGIKPYYHNFHTSWVERAVSHEKGASLEPRIFRKSVFLAVGGFPEIGLGEDQILLKKIDSYVKKHGLKIVVAPDIVVRGNAVESIHQLYRQAVWYGKTYVPFVKTLFKETSFVEGASIALATFLRPIYFLSFVFFVLSFIFPSFFIAGIPFLAIFGVLVLKSLIEVVREGNVYRLLRVGLFVFFGAAMLYGFLLNVLGIDKKMGA